MDEQVFTVEIPHGIGVVCCRGVTFQTHYISVVYIKVHHFGFHPEKVCRKVGVKLRVNPTLAHIDIQLFIRYRFGRCVLQCPCGDFRPIPFPAGQVIKAGCEFLVLVNHISGKKPAFVFPFFREGIVVNLALQRCDYIFIRQTGRAHDIVHFHLAVEIEAACQCFRRL